MSASPGHRAPTSPRLIGAAVVAGLGVVSALVLSLGGAWWVRAGVVVAWVSALVVVWLLRSAHRQQLSEERAQARMSQQRQAAQLTSERRAHRDVVEVLDGRLRTARQRIAVLSDELDAVRALARSLESDREILADGIEQRELQIAEFRHQIAARKAEIAALRQHIDGAADAEVLALPRRMWSGSLAQHA